MNTSAFEIGCSLFYINNFHDPPGLMIYTLSALFTSGVCADFKTSLKMGLSSVKFNMYVLLPFCQQAILLWIMRVLPSD
jgi:hypothetical protein